MKQQIERLSPHQNGKVFAVLDAMLTPTGDMPTGVRGKFITQAFEDTVAHRLHHRQLCGGTRVGREWDELWV